MPLIISVSGIRGTIGGFPGEGLTPLDIVAFTAGYSRYIQSRNPGRQCRVVVGRDARISGAMVSEFVCNTLTAMGIDTLELGLATTPTVEMAVINEQASGGIIITASHNPMEWNALKLLNEEGEFLSAEEGELIREFAGQGNHHFVSAEDLGQRVVKNNALDEHIDKIIQLETVDAEVIGKAGFKIVVDAVNSVGGVAVPALLKKLGVQEVIMLNGEPDGRFSHNPEPLPEHLEDLAGLVVSKNASLGIAVDPDVDRLALVCENGKFFGEEYTLVAVADYILQSNPGPVVSNMSSSSALNMVAAKYGCKRFASAVGEAHVVRKMKETGAVIGGEGNGGIIYPPLHYGRDALAGIALFLTWLAKSKKSASALRNEYPDLSLMKTKMEVPADLNTDELFSKIEAVFPDVTIDKTDGLYLNFRDAWVHIRKSNTEPILRIYAESDTEMRSSQLIDEIKNSIN